MPGRLLSEEEDRAEVEVIESHMAKGKQLTTRIEASRAQVSACAAQVEQAIKPIYANTKQLHVVGNNIDMIIAAINAFRSPLSVAQDESAVISKGLSAVGLSAYLASLNRISQALTALKKSNIRSSQDGIKRLTTLLERGSGNLEQTFRDILQDECRPVEPLHYITKELPFPILPPEKVSRLALINNFLSTQAPKSRDENEPLPSSLNAYVNLRSTYITRTLENMSAASITTSRKTSPDALYKQGANGIGTYATGLEGILMSEYDNICQLFLRENWNAVFDRTSTPAMQEFARTLRELNSHIKQNITTDCFLAYEIIDIVTPLSIRLSTKTGSAPLKDAFRAALKPIRETAKLSLSELLDDSRKRALNLQSIPTDGSAVPVTRETVARIQALTEYQVPLATIMISLGEGNWFPGQSSVVPPAPSLTSFDISADGRQLLTKYICDTIDTLMKALEQKAKPPPPRKPGIQMGAFLYNNLHVINNGLAKPPLSLLSIPSSRLEALKKRFISLYLDAWKEPASHLIDVTYTTRQSTRPQSSTSADIVKSLSSKEKDQLRDKVKAFFSSFDLLVAQHNSALAMDGPVKAALGKEVRGLIEPLYARFWDRYHDLDRQGKGVVGVVGGAGKGRAFKLDKSQMGALMVSLVET